MKNIKGIIKFFKEDKIYSDHFPGNPTVPGSLIIHSFYLVLKKNEVNIKNLKIKNFKFKKFISPLNYNYSIEIQNKTAKCSLYLDDKIIVSGFFEL